MTVDGEDLETAYRGYEATGRSDTRWAADNPGNAAIHAQRNDAFRRLLEACAADGPLRRTLEVGCGTGALLAELGAMAPLRDATCVGIDLLAFRLAIGADGAEHPLVQADGQHLPFPDEVFDVVVLSTVISSVPPGPVSAAVVAECDRVLRPGGSVLWYDMRYPNPGNRNVRPVRRRDLANMFSGYRLDLQSITLVPQVARRLGPATPALYRALGALPFLRSHLVGLITKPR